VKPRDARAGAGALQQSRVENEKDSDMLIRNWQKWAAVLACGAALLQVPSCTDAATVVTGIASTITAGGVIYIIARIMD
jgi:hypothetical protein